MRSWGVGPDYSVLAALGLLSQELLGDDWRGVALALEAERLGHEAAAPEGRQLPSPTDLDFGEDLYAARRALGLSQDAAASLLGVSAQTVWSWETGRSRPRGSSLSAIVSRLRDAKRALDRHHAPAGPFEEAAVLGARTCLRAIRAPDASVAEVTQAVALLERLAGLLGTTVVELVQLVPAQGVGDDAPS